jgi:hypothetical protein
MLLAIQEVDALASDAKTMNFATIVRENRRNGSVGHATGPFGNVTGLENAFRTNMDLVGDDGGRLVLVVTVIVAVPFLFGEFVARRHGRK